MWQESQDQIICHIFEVSDFIMLGSIQSNKEVSIQAKVGNTISRAPQIIIVLVEIESTAGRNTTRQLNEIGKVQPTDDWVRTLEPVIERIPSQR